jgi:hypothetical protein
LKIFKDMEGQPKELTGAHLLIGCRPARASTGFRDNEAREQRAPHQRRVLTELRGPAGTLRYNAPVYPAHCGTGVFDA